jgi:uncharacterized protein
MPSNNHQPLFEIHPSTIHGLGAFATQKIGKDVCIIEYLGERITHNEANGHFTNELIQKIDESAHIIESLGVNLANDNSDEREPSNHSGVLLFRVNEKTFIDGDVIQNNARFINHSCEPNCQAVLESGRVYIKSQRTIQAGEELTFDYRLERLEGYDSGQDNLYACHCGAKNCRRTLFSSPPKVVNEHP